MKVGLKTAAIMTAMALSAVAADARALMIAMPQRDVPTEIIATEADAIVVATVTAMPEAPKADPNAPGIEAGNGRKVIRRPFPGRGVVGEVKFKVDKVIFKNGIEIDAGKEIALTINQMGRPTTVKVGDKVVTAIKKNGDAGDKFYTLPYDKAFSTDIDASTKFFEKAVDIDKWNWGKEEAGLRAIALSRSVNMNAANGNAFVSVSVGLRNVSKESIFVNTFPGDQTLKIKAFWDGTPVTAGTQNANADFGPYQANAYTAEIKPGQVVWISQWGISPEGTQFSVQSPEGKCELKVSYGSTRDGDDAKKLWKGTVTAAPITVDIAKAKAPANPRIINRGDIQVRPLPGKIENIQPLPAVPAE